MSSLWCCSRRRDTEDDIGEIGLSLIEGRHCTHSFDPLKPVVREQIERILVAARNVPSTNNTQPWTVIVVQGAVRDELVKKMLAKFDAGDDGSAGYANRPKEMPEQMTQAMSDFAEQFYTGHFGVERGDKQKRREQYRANYELWGAPVHLVLCAPSTAVAGTFLDMGSYMTGILLAAHAIGLGGKPQFSVAKYHDVCRKLLGSSVLPDSLTVVCGISVGYPTDGRDPRDKPDFFPSRIDIQKTTRWATDKSYLGEAVKTTTTLT